MEHVKQTVDLLMGELVRDGFLVEQLRRQIEEAVTMNLPAFKVNCNATYGDERMSYELSFMQTSNQELPYNFTELKATHRDPVDIDERVINGIATLALDHLMAQVDWTLVFSGGQNNAAATRLIGELRKLADDDPAYGRYTQQCLMYKHWPQEVFQKYRDPEMPDLQKAHEHSYTFKAANGDTLNAHLAYHIISERYDSLRDIIDGIGLQGLGGAFPAYDLLSAQLSKNAEAFSLDGHFSLPEGYVSFALPVSKINGWYSTQEYELSLTLYPIHHDTFNGVNTHELEAEMMKVNWKKDHELFIFREDREPDFQPAVNSIQEQLYRVSQDLAGEETADLLRLKYFQGVSFFDDSISQRAWDRLDELPKLTRKFPTDQDITSAIYLMAGRAVFASVGPEHTENIRHWCRLDLTDAAGGYSMHSFESYSRQELSDLLRPLLYHHAVSDPLAGDLMKGAQIKVTTPAGKKIVLEANPEQRSLNFFTEDMRPIPVNLHLDPDWEPPILPQDNAEKQKAGQRQTSGKQLFKKQTGKHKVSRR